MQHKIKYIRTKSRVHTYKIKGTYCTAQNQVHIAQGKYTTKSRVHTAQNQVHTYSTGYMKHKIKSIYLQNQEYKIKGTYSTAQNQVHTGYIQHKIKYCKYSIGYIKHKIKSKYTTKSREYTAQNQGYSTNVLLFFPSPYSPKLFRCAPLKSKYTTFTSYFYNNCQKSVQKFCKIYLPSKLLYNALLKTMMLDSGLLFLHYPINFCKNAIRSPFYYPM